MAHARGRSRRRLPALLSVVALLLLAGVAQIGSARSDATAATGPAASPGAADTGGSSVFADRAGYVADRVGLVPGAAPATGSRLLVVTFQSRDPSLFRPLSPGAPPLTLPEIADLYGLTPAQYASMEQYFVGEGLSIVHTWPDRLSLTVQGPVTAVDRAFSTSLLEGTYDGRLVSFPSVPPSLPFSLERQVESVTGLSSGFDSFLLPSTPSSPISPGGAPTSSINTDLVTPGVARQIYDLSSLYNRTGAPEYASSQSLAVLLWGPGYVPSDLSTFYSQDYPSGFPTPKWEAIPVDGASAPSSAAANDRCGAAEELTLDLEWTGSMAPGATLYAVYAPEGATGCSPSASTMSDAMHTAIGLPIAALSMSFGSPESTDGSLRATWDTYLAEAVRLGITPLAATGDLGGDLKTGCQGGPSAQYPSTSPDVIAVGGTDVALNRNLLGQVTGFSETAWNDSGGGFSTQFAAPSWQDLGSAYRGTPDVSATAADNYLYFNGQPEVAGGTSFATPLWAGLVTEMEAQYGRSMAPLAPRLYAIGAEEPLGKIGPGLADIVSGATCLGSASAGWDEETGWGSPRALLLYEDLTATFVALSLKASPATTGPGGSVTIAVHLANATSGAPIAGVPVLLSLASTTGLGPCTGSFGSSSPTTGPSGNVSVTISVPACYLGSSASASASVQSNGLYGTNSTEVAVNLLAFVPFLSGLLSFPGNVVGFAAIFVAAGLLGYFLGRPRRRPPSEPASSAPPAASSEGPAEPPPSVAGGEPSTPVVSPPPPSAESVSVAPAAAPPPIELSPTTSGEPAASEPTTPGSSSRFRSIRSKRNGGVSNRTRTI